MKKRFSWGTLVLGAALGFALTFVGLADAGKLKAPKEPEVLVALGQLLDAEHQRIDILVERGDVDGAIAALENLVGHEWPDRDRGGDASVLLRHDAYGRLVRLRLDHPQIDPRDDQVLLELVEEGLGKDYELVDPNPFTARLVGMKGELLERMGRDDDALTAYEDALDMNRDVLDELMQEGPG